MAYTPTDWKTGDVITADKLNNIESGIVASLAPDLIIKATDTSPYPYDYNPSLIKGDFQSLKEKWQNGDLLYAVIIEDGKNVGGGILYINPAIIYMSNYSPYGECFKIQAVVSEEQKLFMYLLSDGSVVKNS